MLSAPPPPPACQPTTHLRAVCAHPYRSCETAAAAAFFATELSTLFSGDNCDDSGTAGQAPHAKTRSSSRQVLEREGGAARAIASTSAASTSSGPPRCLLLPVCLPGTGVPSVAAHAAGESYYHARLLELLSSVIRFYLRSSLHDSAPSASTKPSEGAAPPPVRRPCVLMRDICACALADVRCSECFALGVICACWVTGCHDCLGCTGARPGRTPRVGD